MGLCSCDRNVFWHMSDIHMQADYYKGSDPSKKCVEGTGKAGRFGDYNCRSPYEVELSVVNSFNTLYTAKKPEFILYTGDFGASYKGAHTQETSTMYLKNVTGVLTLAQTLTGARIFPLLGNHDANPEHNYVPEGDWLYTAAGDLWSKFLSADAITTFKKGGYYTELIHPGLRLIALNTNIYYQRNKLVNLKDSDPAGQFAWLKSQLKAARAAGELVYIAGHVPPGNMSSTENFHRVFNKPFLSCFTGYHDIIVASFWGHLHIDWWAFIGTLGTTGKYHPAFLVSTLASKTNSDPTVRLFEYDSKSFKLMDFTTFYMNLTAANKNNKITWKKMYKASEAYGLSDLSAASMYSEYKKMKSSTTEFNKVYKRRKAITSSCSTTCRTKALCAMGYTDVSEYEKCIA